MNRIAAFGQQWGFKIRVISVLLCLGIAFQPLSGAKMRLRPYKGSSSAKKHPYVDQLRQASSPIDSQRKDQNYEQLLVILVDFQEELPDDPYTTGNGKFQLEADPSYQYSIGAPPHNREYFEENLSAMYHYYQAVSAGTYHLSYDVWPKDKPAYTLPKSLSYYNPPDASSNDFVEKMEEYFKTAFETADADDPEINFSSYGHYMIIHAGSDWQHDIMGDSPSDLPSFFITVGEGKEAVVDGGGTLISRACNVPATISQDFSVSEEDGHNIHSGYGALNAVLFHEFGHSLGLVDLYNVRTFYPMVGSFDIMDSGGSGVLVDELTNGDWVMVEGALPTLPGAFSRALLFAKDLREKGAMIDFEDLPPNIDSNLAASSRMPDGMVVPTIIKYRLNPREYYLFENRSVDPDGDGGTAVFGSLDSRVILYPTPFADPDNNPSYEYDYLLPSFIGTDGSAVGGGILAWYVNEEVIYDEGQILEDDTLWSNFQNNSINTNFNRPGVRVLEADGLQDIGEPYSSYWTGTAYEYFHARKPLLDGEGRFVNWTQEIWRPTLSSSTNPALVDENGLGSVFYLDDISNPSALMSFKAKSSFFPDVFAAQLEYPSFPAALINTNYSDISVPFFGLQTLNLYSYLNSEWQNLLGSSPLLMWSFSHAPVVCDVDLDGYQDLVVIQDKVLHFINFSDITIQEKQIVFPDALHAPVVYDNSLYLYSDAAIYRMKDFAVENYCSIPGVKGIALWQDRMAVQLENELKILKTTDFSELQSLALPESFGAYNPVLWHHQDECLIFLTADSGNIYSFDGSSLHKVFSNPGLELPSQPGLFQEAGDVLKLFFGLGNRAYLIHHNGLLEAGFPLYLDQVLIEEHGLSRAVMHNDQVLMYLPVKDQGTIAISDSAELRADYAMLYHLAQIENDKYKQDYLQFDSINGNLLWYYAVGDQAKIHSMPAISNPILWNARDAGSAGSLNGGPLQGLTPPQTAFDAYVYPNPVRDQLFRLRVLGAQAGIKIRVFDVSGTIVYQRMISENFNAEDIELDSSNLSSGVYIVNVQSGSNSKTLKFAIEK
ncbi:MAG: T9SS type A sorting domain-containing protein [Candidatus Cloacimonetes bacterium]|nr:T9SS type A sorting domain-containing protein [Candidatus Cloacimonadota bacterium]MDD3097055.1 T9SS type A sorting domain-containing protein [Candidatus Cloacimonadota bacterium]